MTSNTIPKAQKKQTKIEQIEERFGHKFSKRRSDKELKEYLIKNGVPSLAKLLQL